MKPILVHCHIYYPAMWTELKTCIKNIEPCPFKLYVTLVDNHQDIIDDIKATFQEAQIEFVENRGYDVGPFVHIINKINLDDYSYVIKLHTKRNLPEESLMNYYDVSGSNWRDYLLDFISTRAKFQSCIQAFEKKPKLGMISNYHLILKKEYYDKRAQEEVKEFLGKLGYKKTKYGFVGGTMFITKAKLLKPLQKLNISLSDFNIPDKNHSSTLAHTVERLLGCLVLAENHKIDDVLTKKKYVGKMKRFLLKLKIFIFQKRVNTRGILTVKILKIPIYRKRVEK